jgi:cell wall-associated NlpC family hydrolase
MRLPLRFVVTLVAVMLFTEACYRPDVSAPDQMPAGQKRSMAVRMGWAIQAGAFSNLDNAVRLSNDLNSQGLEATFFRDSDNLYKVRFGDFKNREAARNRAEVLKSKRILEAYYLIAPETLVGSMIGDSRAETGIRKSLISTAESYLGIPYRWGGTSAKTGFDCSGLTQAVYKLNGLSIPRTSRDQYSKGSPVSKNKLRGGDLLFFSAAKGGSINHVAIYVENGVFIHAPSSGQVIRKDNLNAQTWSRQFVGARTYL